MALCSPGWPCASLISACQVPKLLVSTTMLAWLWNFHFLSPKREGAFPALDFFSLCQLYYTDWLVSWLTLLGMEPRVSCVPGQCSPSELVSRVHCCALCEAGGQHAHVQGSCESPKLYVFWSVCCRSYHHSKSGLFCTPHKCKGPVCAGLQWGPLEADCSYTELTH